MQHTLIYIPIVLAIIFGFIIMKHRKRDSARQQETLKAQQRLDALVDRINTRIKKAEESKHFYPALVNLIDELRAFRHESMLHPSVELSSLERAETELDNRVNIALIRADLISNASTIYSGMPKTITEIQKGLGDVRKEYEVMISMARNLIDVVPGFTLDKVTNEHIDNLKGLYIDLKNAIDLCDVSKFAPIKASIVSAQRKYINVVHEQKRSINTILNRIQHVETFAERYRAKIEESWIQSQAEYISHSSRASYENLVPHMRSMLERLGNEANFTNKQILCKEIETTYNSAISDFTKEIAEHNKMSDSIAN